MRGPVAILVCPHCGRRIEACAACEREDCPEGICYACLVLRLGVSRPQPHEHGG